MFAEATGTFLGHDAKVYVTIKNLLSEQPGCSYIFAFDAAADGHAAWLPDCCPF